MTKIAYSNRNHRELREGEVFVANLLISDYDVIMADWKTKRMGKAAYNIYGEMITGVCPPTYPVFAQKTELSEKGIDVGKM